MTAGDFRAEANEQLSKQREMFDLWLTVNGFDRRVLPTDILEAMESAWHGGWAAGSREGGMAGRKTRGEGDGGPNRR